MQKSLFHLIFVKSKSLYFSDSSGIKTKKSGKEYCNFKHYKHLIPVNKMSDFFLLFLFPNVSFLFSNFFTKKNEN